MKGFKERAQGKVIDGDVEKMLIHGLEPSSLPEPVKARMRTMLMKRVCKTANLPGEFITVRKSEGKWIEIAAGVFQKKLVQNGKMNASLYQMLPGSFFPAHDHPSDEECICLHGEVNLGGTIIKAGEFHLAPRGLPHGKITTTEGCLLYVRCGAECDKQM